MRSNEFLEIIKSNQGLIYKLVGLYSDDEEEKKDLYQEIMFQAWKSWPSFKGNSKITTWLYKVSLNTILTQKRKSNILVYDKSMESLPATVINSAAHRDDVEKLYTAIKMLKETDRAIIAMHLDGYENEEISVLMGISANNTAVKLHRIKQQLSILLNKL